ncbi:glycerate kinase [Fischerella thermalis]|uniref:glycerate kinase n=1 Tax=Fischerella thermalis TaxID=372787 RepID=UPI000C80B271|nr:glycerate kinase [Fischerella thermalis]PLZ90243.1 glycerate kinase [Fischerella thermalis CCMEE 5194]
MTNDLFKSIYLDVLEFCQSHLQMQPQAVSEVLGNVWLPLATRLVSHRQQLNRPLIQGILGGQGTGKTTLCRVLALIIGYLGYNALSLSLDDLYKTYRDRQILKQHDPRLIWRGPPGTHDVELGLTVLDKIRSCELPVSVPRFDKSAYNGAGDRTTPEIVTNADIVLFEGWFVGVRPIDPSAFDHPPPPILTPEDQAFARDINDKLRDYLPLWERLDSLIVLYPKDYRFSLEWRQQAERQMIALGKPGMTDSEIEQFVKYFWCSLHPELFIKPLIESPTLVDLVIEINSDHSFGNILS